MPLCNHCQGIRPGIIKQAEWQPYHLSSVGEMLLSAETCELCALFLSTIPSDLKHAESQVSLLSNNSNFGGPPRSIGKPYQGLSLRCLKLGLTPQFQDEDQEISSHISYLDIFAESDSPAAVSGDVIGRPVRSADDIGQIREWLDICRSGHGCLSSKKAADRVLPTRVLDTTTHGDPILVESNGAKGAYIALSHRWGGARITQTTKSNLASNKQAIPYEQLCTTFKDAITFTRNLGYQYLWIDSLCIIQDDVEDWKREAAKMADVYQNADLTLSAACATSGDTGLFGKREKYAVVEMPYFTKDGTLDGSYYITNCKVHDIEQEVTSGPLNTRAWVLQERNLSPRTLHFGTTQRLWECQESAWEESCILECLCSDRFGNGHFGFGGYGSKSFVGKFEMLLERPRWAEHLYSTKYMYPAWYHLVESYMRRGLTVESDKLPAISGLARVFADFARVYKEDRYLAGIWENDFAQGLIWCSQAEDGLRRPHKMRAPSWSWAAWDGPVSYIEVNRIASYNMMLENVAVSLGDTGADQFGDASSTTACLAGYVVPLRAGPYQESVTVDTRSLGYPETGYMNTTLLGDDGKPVGCGWLDEGPRAREKNICCLLVFQAPRRHIESTILEDIIAEFLWCLILEETGSNVYKRVGIAQVYQWIFTEDDKSVITLS